MSSPSTPCPQAGRCLVVFSKPARPGRVKTRLIGDLSAAQAAAVHAAFVGDVVERLRGGAFRLRLAWALEPGEEPPALADFGLESTPSSGRAVESVRQEGPGLGERLFNALADAARDHPFVAALGSDHPTVSAARVERAFELLEAGAPVVIGPADDGGYYLLAAAAEALSPELFREVPWSTPEVFEATLGRCRTQGLEPALLPAGADVDTPEDLARLAARLVAGETRCPRTHRLLASWGRLGPAASP